MAQTQQYPKFEHIDPASLLVDINVRNDARLDKQFLANVKENGVLVPVVAVATDDGVRVRMGHRRTLAAAEAGHASIPVLIAGTDSDDDETQVARLIEQYSENTHRAGLTTSEQVGVVEQLAAFGLSAHQIAKRTKMSRPDAKAAVTVAESELASKATERWDWLTLDQAAVLAEFEDDPDTAKALIAAASRGEFEHVAQRARDRRETQALHDQVVAEIESTGIRLIDRLPTQGAVGSDLKDDQGNPLSMADHADCPGHVGWVRYSYVLRDRHGDVICDETLQNATDEERDALLAGARDRSEPGAEWGCEAWREHGHTHAYRHLHSPEPTGTKSREDMTEEEREEAKAERKRVIANNKEWAAAETVRGHHLQQVAQRKTAPKAAAAFVAAAIAADSDTLNSVGANHLAAQWLGEQDQHGFGRSHYLTSLIADASPARAQVIAMVQVLAAYEHRIDREAWRNPLPEHKRYLEFIRDHLGYTLSDVEQLALDT